MNQLLSKLFLVKHQFLQGLPSAPDVPSSGNVQLDTTTNQTMQIIFALAVATAIVSLIVLGVMFLWPSKRDKAKDHSIYVIIGILIIFSASAIVAFLSGFQIL